MSLYPNAFNRTKLSTVTHSSGWVIFHPEQVVGWELLLALSAHQSAMTAIIQQRSKFKISSIVSASTKWALFFSITEMRTPHSTLDSRDRLHIKASSMKCKLAAQDGVKLPPAKLSRAYTHSPHRMQALRGRGAPPILLTLVLPHLTPSQVLGR